MTEQLPKSVRELLWDVDPRGVSLSSHPDFLTERVLAHGSWDAIQWMRQAAGDAGLRSFLLRRRGRGLSPRQLRFWQAILGLPSAEVDAWLSDPARAIWDRRTA